MKPVVELTESEYKLLSEIWQNLRARTNEVSRNELITLDYRAYGYTHYNFSGEIHQRLVDLLGREPTDDELIMLVDGGFSHSGASCTIFGRSFQGCVCTDG